MHCYTVLYVAQDGLTLINNSMNNINQSLTQTYLKVSAECQLKGAGTLLHVALVQGQTCHQQMGLDRVAVVADAPLQ